MTLNGGSDCSRPALIKTACSTATRTLPIIPTASPKAGLTRHPGSRNGCCFPTPNRPLPPPPPQAAARRWPWMKTSAAGGAPPMPPQASGWPLTSASPVMSAPSRSTWPTRMWRWSSHPKPTATTAAPATSSWNPRFPAIPLRSALTAKSGIRWKRWRGNAPTGITSMKPASPPAMCGWWATHCPTASRCALPGCGCSATAAGQNPFWPKLRPSASVTWTR